MKYAAIALTCLLGLAWAQEEGGEPGPEEEQQGGIPPAAVEDPAKILSDLTLANAAKDLPRVDAAAKQALAWAKSAKDEDLIESMTKELADSLKVAKGNWGTLYTIMEAIGELHHKAGAKILKKYATQKRVKLPEEEKLQAIAVIGLGRMADPRDINTLAEISKNDSTPVAKAAYQAFASYANAKGKVRKQCAETLMKRLDMEYPSSGGQGGKSVSAEKQERWKELSPAIVSSMQAICRQPTIPDIENWREWWRENKKNARAWRDDDES